MSFVFLCSFVFNIVRIMIRNNCKISSGNLLKKCIIHDVRLIFCYFFFRSGLFQNLHEDELLRLKNSLVMVKS